MGEAKRDDRRNFDRFEVTWDVDCTTEDTFLYASISNISQMGIFVTTTDPLPIGAKLMLAFTPKKTQDADATLEMSSATEPFKLEGVVAWVNAVKPNGDNPNPGMGVRFVDLTLPDRERIVDLVRAIAYLREQN
ncbi:MAG: PilZ domain-containing protein [Polyangiaceae bacterium]